MLFVLRGPSVAVRCGGFVRVDPVRCFIVVFSESSLAL